MKIFNIIKSFVKRNPEGLGYFFIALSLILFILNFNNSKLSINDLSEDNIQYYAEQIDGLGVDTLRNIIKNQPYTDMAQLLNVEGVGETKYKIIVKHFGETEPCRRGTFIFSVFLMIFFNVLGTCLIRMENERRLTDAKIIMGSMVLKQDKPSEYKTKEKVKYKMKE